MTKKATTPPPPSSYNLLAHRVQKLILAPRAQLERRVVITRAPDELEADWDLLLDQLGEEESVTTTPLEDGSVRLTWVKPDVE